MAITGAYDATKLVIGPGKLYSGVPLPADGASISTVLTGGVPATGHLIGYTKAGTTVHNAMTLTGYEVDEVKSPIFQNVTAEPASIQGTLVQIVDLEALKLLLPNATFVTPDSFNIGGATTQYLASICIVGQDRTSPTPKHVAAMLFSAMNTQEFILQVTRANPSETAFTFTAQAIGSRSPGNQLGGYWFEGVV